MATYDGGVAAEDAPDAGAELGERRELGEGVELGLEVFVVNGFGFFGRHGARGVETAEEEAGRGEVPGKGAVQEEHKRWDLRAESCDLVQRKINSFPRAASDDLRRYCESRGGRIFKAQRAYVNRKKKAEYRYVVLLKTRAGITGADGHHRCKYST